VLGAISQEDSVRFDDSRDDRFGKYDGERPRDPAARQRLGTDALNDDAD